MRRSPAVAPLLAALALVGGCGFSVDGLSDEPFLAMADATVPEAASDAVVVAEAADRDDAAFDTEAPDTAPDIPLDTAPPCTETGSVVFEGRCYFVIAILQGFADARAACANAMPPAHLAAITSAGEQTTIAELAAGRQLWIGLRKDAAAPSARESFTWVTGEVSSYHNWAPEDPNGGHDCARLRADRLWGDMSCSTTIASVCERE